MRALKKIVLVFLLAFGIVIPVKAQYLEDDVKDKSKATYVDETEKSEKLFNELFSDYPETERDITKTKTFDDAMEQTSDFIKKEELESIKSAIEAEKRNIPINGDMEIGITKNSFSIYKNTLDETACSFSITLKSNLNKNIRMIGLYLVYPKRTFAFVFKDIKPEGYQERKIRTTGDICYNLTGTPDINISKCKIYGASGQECAKRMKWSEDIKMPEGTENTNKLY